VNDHAKLLLGPAVSSRRPEERGWAGANPDGLADSGAAAKPWQLVW